MTVIQSKIIFFSALACIFIPLCLFIMLLSHKNGNLLIFIIYIAIECLLSYAYARDLEPWIHLS